MLQYKVAEHQLALDEKINGIHPKRPCAILHICSCLYMFAVAKPRRTAHKLKDCMTVWQDGLGTAERGFRDVERLKCVGFGVVDGRNFSEGVIATPHL